MFICLRSMCNRLKLGACVFGCWIERLLCCMSVDSGKSCQSRPGELVSPRRECLRPTQVLLEQLAQAKGLVFERCVVSLRREYLAQASSRRRSWCALFAASSRRGVLFLGEGRSRPGELISPKRDARRVPCSKPRLGEMA